MAKAKNTNGKELNFEAKLWQAADKMRTTATEIEQFLIKPLDAIYRSQEFSKEWKSAGPWK